ncbi:hypothetical protein LINPERHAP1_LOCUS14834 [Linum perenne]
MEKLFSSWFYSNARRRIGLMTSSCDVDGKSENKPRRSLKKYLFSSNSRKHEETVSNPEKVDSQAHPVVATSLRRSYSFSKSECTHSRFSTSCWMGSNSKEEVIPITVEDDDIVFGGGSLTSRSSSSSSVDLGRRSKESEVWAVVQSKELEKHRLLRQRVRYLAEQNVLLQKEASESTSVLLACSEEQVKQLSSSVQELTQENEQLRQNLSELQEDYKAAEEELSCLRMDLDNAVVTSKDNALLKIELQAEELLTSLMKKNLYAKELQVQQLQTEIAALNNHTHKSKDFILLMLRKDEIVTEIEHELSSTKEILQKVAEERDMVWEEVNKYKEMNMVLKCEVGFLKNKVEELDEEVLVKEGEITILRDSFWEKL